MLPFYCREAWGGSTKEAHSGEPLKWPSARVPYEKLKSSVLEPMRFYFLCFLFLSLLSLKAQSPRDTVDFDNPDISLIENLVREKIDSLRLCQHLRPLRYDFILNKAAEDQAFYLMTRNKISHYQGHYKKHDVLQRLRFFGAENLTLAGENLLWQHPGRLLHWSKMKRKYVPRFFYTYDSLAAAIVAAWVKSPGHYRNLLMPEYNRTAVAIAFDMRRKNLICVQVFASVPVNGKKASAGIR